MESPNHLGQNLLIKGIAIYAAINRWTSVTPFFQNRRDQPSRFLGRLAVLTATAIMIWLSEE
jgi:hypothetical protein